ncbi:MAG: hypothetical protein HC905_06530 [Bacteroidales bacterium]|nr:hypothetical protein [Bacteroidales bacterium]
MKSEEQEQVHMLIRNYLDGTLTQDDISVLGKWVEASEENKKYYQQVKNIWEISAVAKADIHISADTAFDKVLGKITEKSNKKSFYFYIQRVAAILLIPLILAGFLLGRYSENKAYNSSVIYNEVYAPAGTRSSLTLADGTRVWLNSGSKLRYPDKFGKGNRLVYLTGEAFFEVESDINKPFIVKTPSVSVRATGTRFNVEAYSSDAEIQVSLLTGKVSVHRGQLTKRKLLYVMS